MLLPQFAFTPIWESSIVKAYTLCIYSDQGKQYSQGLHSLYLLLPEKVVRTELTTFAFTLIREVSMVRAYIIGFYSNLE